MINFREQKKIIMFILAVSSTILSGTCAIGVQSNEYESRLKQAEELIRPKIAVFDLHEKTDLKIMALDLMRVAKDPQIHGVLLWINSPGGAFSEFTSIHDTLLRIRKLKPVVALVRGNALSCGYLIASTADYIIAYSKSQLGCIGVLSTFTYYKNPKIRLDRIEADFDVVVFSSGKYKKALASEYASSQLTQEERDEAQRLVDDVYQVFIESVAHNRNLDITKADQWADGRSFIAHKAVERGLIDEIGTAFEAEEKMIELIREKNPDTLVSRAVEYIFFDCVAHAPSK